MADRGRWPPRSRCHPGQRVAPETCIVRTFLFIIPLAVILRNGREWKRGARNAQDLGFLFALRDIAHVWVFQLQASAWG